MTTRKQFLNTTYIRYSDELAGYLRKQFKFTSNDSEDVVQTAFAKFAELPDVQTIENPGAFLYRTAHNIVLDRKRREGVQERNVVELKSRSAQSEHGPERILVARKRLEALSGALNNMPEKRRAFLLMSRFDELSNVEIAKQAGLSESAVRKQIAKALLDCKQALDNEMLE